MAVHLADLVGVKNGTNTLFATPTAYAPGSITVRLADTNLISTDIVEVDAPSGLVALAQAPLVDDLLIAAYEDPPEVVPGIVNGPAVAFVQQIAELSVQGGNDLIFRAGQSGALLDLTVLDKDGVRFDLRGSVLYFEAKKNTTQGLVIFDKSSSGSSPKVVFGDQATDAGRGRAQVLFDASETLAASGMMLLFDFWAKTSGGNLIPLIQEGHIEVRGAVRTTFP